MSRKRNPAPHSTPAPASPDGTPPTMRLDKWLWCARFYKTRSLAAEEIARGRVLVNDALAKPARDVRIGDTLHIRQTLQSRTVQVQSLLAMRGPASVAQQMYAETEQSVAERTQQAELRRLAPEPASDLRHGRPTKKDRRDFDQLRQQGQRSALNERWSASVQNARD